MATANLFHREVKANKSPRNAFNVSYSTLFTSPCGMLLPSYVQEVKRGDKLKLGVTSLTRTAPVSTPAFMSFDEKTDFWFVPYRLIWSDYENWRLAQTFRNRTTSLMNVGRQNFLPFTSFQSFSLFFEQFTRSVVGSALMYNKVSPCSALRYLDLLGYAVPDIPNLFGTVDLSTSYLSTANVDDPTDSSNVLLKVVTYYNQLSTVTPVNYFRLAAFQCIYQHGYRNEEYEQLNPSAYNVDNLFANLTYDNSVSLQPAQGDEVISTPTWLSVSLRNMESSTSPNALTSKLGLRHLFAPRYKNWRKDVFTSAKPENGFYSSPTGVSTGLQIDYNTGNVSDSSSTYGTGFYWPTKDTSHLQAGNGEVTDDNPQRYNPLNGLISGDDYNYGQLDWTYQTDGSNAANVVSRLYTEVAKTSAGSTLPGTTFLYPQNIRNLMAQDKFSRAAIYADKDISSQIRALFGENYTDHDTPQYLGSFSSNVSIDDVVAQAAGTAGDSSSILGELAGRVKQSDGKNEVFERSFSDDGVVIGVHYVMPRNNYDSSRLNKWNTKVSRFDYFYPQFDGLGYQPILCYERYIDSGQLIRGAHDSNINYFPQSLFGFVPRYYEYKQRTNEIHSTFQNHQPDFSWTLSNNGINSDTYSSASFGNYKILPNITDRIFNVAWNGSNATDPFQHYFYYDATLVSDMEVYGTPSL